MSSELSKFVKVSPLPGDGIVIFDKIRIDGKKPYAEPNEPKVPVVCYTHYHEDHMTGFEDSLGEIDTTTYATTETWKILRRIKPSLTIKDGFKGLKDHKVEKIDDIEFSFLPCNHIIGSGQVLVRGPEGSVLYSSDFMLKGTYTDVPDVDVLVLDANHGSPDISQKYKTKGEAKAKLQEKIETIVTHAQLPLIIRAHVGTLQDVMLWCHEYCKDYIKFFTTGDRQKKLAEVYQEERGVELREISVNAYDIYKSLANDNVTIRFIPGFTGNITECEEIKPPNHSIHFSDTRFSYDKSADITRMMSINLQEHASHEEILKYVEQISPKEGIVVDNNPKRITNKKNAIDLSYVLQKKYNNLTVEYQPKKRAGENN